MTETKLPGAESPSKKPTRRRFLKTAASAGAVAVAPTIIPSSALGLGDSVAPSERIVVGGLGIGPRGMYDLRFLLKEKDVQFVAICDLQKSAREKVKDLVDNYYGNSDCTMSNDLREYLPERTDIDAILTATGDRWHAMAAILAMRAGKDVYSEKPSSMTIQEGRALVETAKRYDRVYQTGTQRLSERNFVYANEMLRLGRLGQVHTVRAHVAPWVGVIMDLDWLEAQPEPPKDVCDWDIWLGPNPWRPYNEKYVKGGWRGYYDFHTSDIGEWGAHTIAQCQAGLGVGDTCPTKYYPVEDADADGMEVEYESGVKMVYHLDKEKELWRGACGVRYEGDEGWVAIGDNYESPDVSNPRMLDDFNKIIDDYEERTGHPVWGKNDKHGFAMRHIRDFLDCVKSRKETVANPTVMHRSMSAVHASNISMWHRREMEYDPVKEEFVGDDEANRMRSRAQREPWTL